MPIDEATLSRARRFNRTAIEAIFAENYPAVHRIAFALSGRTDVGAGVVRFVYKRAMHALPSWKDDGAPQRWFLHHTVLTVRRAAKHLPTAANDTLIADPATAGAEYIAFIRAVRSLPMQQREAFILRYGERLNERYTSVAMDCSVVAASNHLNAANTAIRTIAGTEFDSLTDQFTRRHRALVSDEAVPLPRLRGIIKRHIWPRRISKIIGWLLLLGFIAAATFAAIKLWPMLEF